MNFKNNKILFEHNKNHKNSFESSQKFDNNDFIFNDKINEEKDELLKKSKEFYKKLISLFGLQNHSKNGEHIKNTLNLKSIKEENIRLINNKGLLEKKKNNLQNLGLLRKKMAYHYRFINNSTKNKETKKNFKMKNKTMNKILLISRSIPDILFQEIKSMKNSKKNYNKYKIYEDDNLFQKNNEFINYRFFSPFKGNRYVGKIYDYYKSNNCLNEEKLIFGKNQNYSINNRGKSPSDQLEKNDDYKLINNNGQIKKTKIKINEKSGIIHLSSLL